MVLTLAFKLNLELILFITMSVVYLPIDFTNRFTSLVNIDNTITVNLAKYQSIIEHRHCQIRVK